MAEDTGEAPSGNLETQAISFLLDVKSNAEEALKKLDAALDTSEKTINKRLDRLAIAINENANRQNAIFNRQAEGIEEMVKGLNGLHDTIEKRFPVGAEATEKFAKTAGKALDDTKDKLNKTGEAAKKMADTTADAAKKAGTSLEGLWDKIKKLDVRNTTLGAFAIAGLKHSYNEANETFEAAEVAPTKTQMSAADVFQRRNDLGAARIATGALTGQLKEINLEFAKVEYRGKIAFQPGTASVMEFSRATGTAVQTSAQLYAMLKSQYNLTDDAAKKQMENVAFLSKNSAVSVENFQQLADELKYVKYGFDAAHGSSEALLKSANEMTATMSRYGGTVADTVKLTKDVTEGGMDEFMKSMQLGVIGGTSPEEMMNLIAEGKIEEINKAEAAGAGALNKMTAGAGAPGKFIFRDLMKNYGKTGAEANRLNAFYEGREEGQPGALNQNLEGDEREKKVQEAMREWSSVSELAARQLERANGMLAATYQDIYDKMLGAAEAIDRAGRSAGEAFNGTPGLTKDIIGYVIQLGLVALAIEKVGKAFKTVFGTKTVTEGIKDGLTSAAESAAKAGAKAGTAAAAEGIKAGETVIAATAEKQAARMAALRAFDGGTKAAQAAKVAGRASAVGGVINAAGVGIEVATQYYQYKGEQIDKENMAKRFSAGIEYMKKAEAAKGTEKEKQLLQLAANAFGRTSGTGIAPETTKRFSEAGISGPGPLKLGTPGKATVASTPTTPDMTKVGATQTTQAKATVESTVAASTPEATPAASAPVASSATEAPLKKEYPRSLGGLEKLAHDNDMYVTATTGGRHTRSSLHYKGQAMDVRTEGESPNKVAAFMTNAKSAGFNVLDARTPDSPQWSGPHIHVSYGVEGKSAQAAMLAQASSGIGKDPASSAPGAGMAMAATTPQRGAAVSVAAPPSAAPIARASVPAPTASKPEASRVSMVTEGDNLIAGELRRIQGILAEHTRLLGRTSAITNKPFSTEAQRHNEIGGGS